MHEFCIGGLDQNALRAEATQNLHCFLAFLCPKENYKQCSGQEISDIDRFVSGTSSIVACYYPPTTCAPREEVFELTENLRLINASRLVICLRAETVINTQTPTLRCLIVSPCGRNSLKCESTGADRCDRTLENLFAS